MDNAANILIVDDEENVRVTLAAIFEDEGYHTAVCQNVNEATDYLIEHAVDVIISDLNLPDGTGLQLLWPLKKIHPDAAFILVTGHGTIDTAIEATNRGVFAYHVKPVDVMELNNSVSNALNEQRRAAENKTIVEKLEQLHKSDMQEPHKGDSPLAVIIGHVNILLEHQESLGPINDRQKWYLEVIREHAYLLGTLIRPIVDISNLETGTIWLAFADSVDSVDASSTPPAYSGFD